VILSLSLTHSLILARHSQKQDEKEPLMGGWIIDGCAAGWPAGRSLRRSVALYLRERLELRADCAHTSMGEKLFCFRHKTPSESGHWPRKGSEPKAPIRITAGRVWVLGNLFALCSPIFSCLFKSTSKHRIYRTCLNVTRFNASPPFLRSQFHSFKQFFSCCEF
jgi:hypothetical protein